MPEPPPGEAELRALASKFKVTEGQVLTWLSFAPVGDRREGLRRSLELLAALRKLDPKGSVVTAYQAENPGAIPPDVASLGGRLASRLDSGVLSASDAARDLFARVTPDNLNELLSEPLTAQVDSRGNRFGLGHWATMLCTTYGRHATSTGLADRVGTGNKVTVSVGQCPLCQEYGGEVTVGVDRLPPYHMSCSCTASAA
jgi:hypothetical protein